jgi:hypothetical protein
VSKKKSLKQIVSRTSGKPIGICETSKDLRTIKDRGAICDIIPISPKEYRLFKAHLPVMEI